MTRKLLSLVLLTLSLAGCAGGYGHMISDKPDTNAARFYANQALIDLHSGRADLAQHNIDLALHYAPDDPLILDAAGFYYEKIAGANFANRYYLAALQVAPHSGSAAANYGAFLCRNERYREAIPYLLAAVSTHSAQSSEALNNARYCTEQLQSKLGAEEEYAYYTNLLWPPRPATQ